LAIFFLRLRELTTRKTIPATGTKYALTVKRCLILWTGNQIAGKLPSQKMKKLTQSIVVVPEFCIVFGMFL
jgi:hypothetical protein